MHSVMFRSANVLYFIHLILPGTHDHLRNKNLYKEMKLLGLHKHTFLRIIFKHNISYMKRIQ